MSQDPAMARFTPARSSGTLDAASSSPVPPAASAVQHQANSASIDGAVGGTWSRRRRWLMGLITPIAVVLMAVGGHRAWTWQAEHRLNVIVDELRRKGEPVSLAEITPKVAKQDNAAYDLRAASDGLPNESELWRAFSDLGPLSLPLGRRDLELVRPILAQNAAAITLVREAMTKPGVDWAPVMPTPTSRPSSPPQWGSRSMGFFKIRGLVQLLYSAALVAHHDGDDAAALAHVDELIFVADATSSRPTVKSQGTALRMYDVALLALAEILPDIASGDHRQAASSGATTAALAGVPAMIARLLDEQDARTAMLRCLRAERARCIETLLSTSSDVGNMSSVFAGAGNDNLSWNDPLPVPWPGTSFERMLSRPVYLARAQQGIERLNLAVSAFDAADLSEFLQAFPENAPARVDANGDPVDDDGDNGYTRMITLAVQQAARMHYAGLAHRRTTAVALAISLYHADHGVWPPADLAPLVPHYLAKMPVDPLSSAGDRLVYLPDPDRPRVYSVGDDGIDDGGVPPAPAINTHPEDYRSNDWVVDLVRQPRRIWNMWPGRG